MSIHNLCHTKQDPNHSSKRKKDRETSSKGQPQMHSHCLQHPSCCNSLGPDSTGGPEAPKWPRAQTGHSGLKQRLQAMTQCLGNQKQRLFLPRAPLQKQKQKLTRFSKISASESVSQRPLSGAWQDTRALPRCSDCRIV